MIALRLLEVADVVGGELTDGTRPDDVVRAVSIDSRAVAPGALFVPLRGERVDGHDFVSDALRRGATAYLWNADRSAPPHPGAIVVDDPADALLGLGAWVRRTVDPAVVAITGSSGKTTTKDLTAAAAAGGLGVDGAPEVVANPGSYNNELGVPLTCCLLEPGSRVLVTEIGARGVGHIARLAPLVAPDVAVVTTVGAAHLEMLGTLEGVARAKRELVESLGDDGVAVLNADDHRVAAMASAAPGRVVTYGAGDDADWRAEAVELDELARPRFRVRGVDVTLPVAGEHNVGNALAALAVVDVLGGSLPGAAAALAHAAVSPWRMQVVRRGGMTIINDAYNANPSSMRAALSTLVRVGVQGRRWAVLGHMAELGPAAQEAHEGIGRLCAELGLDGLIVVGDAAAGIHVGAAEAGLREAGALLLADDPRGALEHLRGHVAPGDAVLVKASRSAGLEHIADGLAGAGDR